MANGHLGSAVVQLARRGESGVVRRELPGGPQGGLIERGYECPLSIDCC